MHIDNMLRLLFPSLFVVLLVALVGNAVVQVGVETEIDQKEEHFNTLSNVSVSASLGQLEGLIRQFEVAPKPENRTRIDIALVDLESSLSQKAKVLNSSTAQDIAAFQRQLSGLASVFTDVRSVVYALENKSSTRSILSELKIQQITFNQTERQLVRTLELGLLQDKQLLQNRDRLQIGLFICLIVVVVLWARRLNARIRTLREEKNTEARRADRLAYFLDHDTETGLINQRLFEEQVWDRHRTLEAGQTLVVLCLRLDGDQSSTVLKHETRDGTLLVAAADSLKQAIDLHAKSAVLARGTDSSFLILSVFEQGITPTPAEVAERLREHMLRPFMTGSGSFPVSPIVGVAEQTLTEKDPYQFILNAELAAQQALSQSDDAVVVYHPSMKAAAKRRIAVEKALTKAIKGNECLPHFQPQFDLKTGQMIGVEALARWFHPDLGWVAPAEFIPIAENSGQIVQFGWKMLETSCAEIQLLPEELTLSVNLSVSQIFNDDVVAMVTECLARTGLPAHRLKLEVTEAALMRDPKRMQETLSGLQDLGCKVSLDDFGVGYSALSYLTEIDWDEIKIDGAFSAKTVEDARRRKIMKLILDISRSMDSDVVIEGIETIEQCDALVQLGCTKGQGYLFGGPMAIDDVKALFFPKRTATG
ncbi:MAG: GGDEF domain-containing phosphodiesterase [Roseibium sp.]